jgi:hypothetical protein
VAFICTQELYRTNCLTITIIDVYIITRKEWNKMKNKKLMVAAAAAMAVSGMAAQGQEITLGPNNPAVGKIVPINLLSASITEGFNPSGLLLNEDDCNNYNCSCLCGVRG